MRKASRHGEKEVRNPVKKQHTAILAAALAGALLLSGCGEAPSPQPATVPTPSPPPCLHSRWEDGVCADCGLVCTHPARVYGGEDPGRCLVCGEPCEHVYKNHACVVCGKKIRHDAHDPNTQLCTECGYFLPHSYENGVCLYCGNSPDFVIWDLPNKFTASSARQGTVEVVEYTAGDHGSGQGETAKELVVYTPGDYDPSRKYDVVLLLHGLGEDEGSWLTASKLYSPTYGSSLCGADLLDKMHGLGMFGDVIVVSATYYRDKKNQRFDISTGYGDFLDEIREDILPAVIGSYSTWAESTSVESIVKARDHFAVAGFSMGAYVITGSILRQAPELFAWYGTYSGNDGSPWAVAEAIDEAAESGQSVRLWYNCAGEDDVAKDPQVRFIELVTDNAASLHRDENVLFHEIPGSGHDYHVWFNGLYNSLLVFFRWNNN